MIIEIFKDSKGEFRFRIKARNGRILAQSEGYKRKWSVDKLIGRRLGNIQKGFFTSVKVKDITKYK